MNDFEKLDKNFNEAMNKLAELLSQNIRNFENKDKRLEFFKNMKNPPASVVLKRINEIAIEREDYETCDALK